MPKYLETGESLRCRQEIYDRYSVPRVDFQRWVLERVNWRGDEHVLDAGCGEGNYVEALAQLCPDVKYTGIDLSHVMLDRHPDSRHTTVGDVEHLPFPDNTFDVVMANHMLFLVSDRNRALREFHRVLKPEGVLLAATNSMHTMPEIQALMRRALVLLGASGKGQVQPPQFPHHAFSLENGTRQLAHHFYAVVRYDLPTALVFPDVDPVMAYLENTRELREPYLPPGVSWDDLMMVMREQIIALLTHFGELVINKISGVLVASDRGGFIHDFVDQRNGRKDSD
ncbi:MAG: class I SAM-dependent methyltransferase [Chloroflexota bacterium]